MTERRDVPDRPERPQRRERIERAERRERPQRPTREAPPQPGGLADEERAVYVISVAAELAGVHPQTLRQYERLGLLRPSRTSGNTRRYSQRDIETLRLIQDLTQGQGINLAGVKVIMAMRVQMEAMQARADRADRDRVGEDRRPSGAIVPLRDLPRAPWGDA